MPGVWRFWRRVAAGGVAAVVVVCVAWAQVAGLAPRHVVPRGHAFRAMAGVQADAGGGLGCTVLSVLRPGHCAIRWWSSRAAMVCGAPVPGSCGPSWSGASSRRLPGGTLTRSAEVGDVLAVTGAAGPVAYRWPWAGRLGLLPGWPRLPARAEIRTLAVRDRAPRGAFRAMPGWCAAGQPDGRAVRLDVMFAMSGKTVLTATGAGPGSRASPAGGPPGQVPAAGPGNSCVMTGGSGHAAAPPQRPDRAFGPAGGSGGLGSGDRASLPGRSTRYRVIWLVCPQCGTEMAVLFYDEGDMPPCANCPHGQMEVQR